MQCLDEGLHHRWKSMDDAVITQHLIVAKSEIASKKSGEQRVSWMGKIEVFFYVHGDHPFYFIIPSFYTHNSENVSLKMKEERIRRWRWGNCEESHLTTIYSGIAMRDFVNMTITTTSCCAFSVASTTTNKRLLQLIPSSSLTPGAAAE